MAESKGNIDFNEIPVFGIKYSYVYDEGKGLFFMPYGKGQDGHKYLKEANNLSDIVAAGTFFVDGDNITADRGSAFQKSGDRFFNDPELPMDLVFKSITKYFPHLGLISVNTTRKSPSINSLRDGD